jgi:hypothetical protein
LLFFSPLLIVFALAKLQEYCGGASGAPARRCTS